MRTEDGRIVNDPVYEEAASLYNSDKFHEMVKLIDDYGVEDFVIGMPLATESEVPLSIRLAILRVYIWVKADNGRKKKYLCDDWKEKPDCQDCEHYLYRIQRYESGKTYCRGR